MDDFRNSIQRGASNVQESLERGASNLQDSFQEGLGSIQDQAQKTFNNFSGGPPSGSSSPTSSSIFPGAATPTPGSGFFNSNNLVAKFAFLVLVLIVFIFLLNLGITLLGYFLRPSSTPYLVHGMLDGTDGHVIHQDPKQQDAVPISRSNNQQTGMEFTWSVWINITTNKANGSQCFHVFNKGDSNFSGRTLAVNVDGAGTPLPTPGANTTAIVSTLPYTGFTINNAPGLYLKDLNASGENTLFVVMDTVDGSNEPVIVPITEIPFNKWVHIAIRLENTLLDVYVNGVITNRVTLPAVAKQNYDDVNVCQNGGFSGQLSNLRYFNYAQSAFEINATVMGGPNTSISAISSANSNTKGTPYFLSSTWYTNKY